MYKKHSCKIRQCSSGGTRCKGVGVLSSLLCMLKERQIYVYACAHIYIHRPIYIFPSGTSIWKWWNSWEIMQPFQVENNYTVVCGSEIVRSLSLMRCFQLVAWEDGKSLVRSKARVCASSITCWGGSSCSLSLLPHTYQLVAEAAFPPPAQAVPS